MRKLWTLWMLSLVVVGFLSALVTAQVNGLRLGVVSGNDIGFRVEGTDLMTGKPKGELVIRVNGEWTAVTAGTKVTPATTSR